MPRKKKAAPKKKFKVKRRPRRTTAVILNEKLFKDSIKKKRKFYTPQRSSKWIEFKPEPDVIARRRILIENLDVVKLGGVGRAFIISNISLRLKRTKFLRGSVKSLRITGRGVDSKGRVIRDKKINIEVGLDKGRQAIQLGTLAAERLGQQVNSFSWKVSSKERQKRKVKGESIRSLKITVELIERKALKRVRKRKKAKKKAFRRRYRRR